MIEISLNNQHHSIALHSTVAAMLDAQGFTAEKVAVAVNRQFVPRTNYAEYILQAGDHVDVLAPVQGG